MTTFIVAIVIFIIAKFVYDTFLTGNTEKDWTEYKKHHPHEARVLETNKGLNMRTKASIRTDGYYVSRYDGPSAYGSNVKLTMMLIFNDRGYVYYEDMEGHPEFPNDQMKSVLTELIGETDLNPNFGKSRLNQNGAIDIILYDPEDFTNEDVSNLLTYRRFQGTVITNGLILDFKQKNYSESIQEFHERTILKELRFDFIKVSFP